ncbi:hypothetical protein [Aliiglaciecola litoralis]|uniref:Uncharacterized protein n=1 Tax=Aliiglaciecola litoralis TaxID=582857 RepID=A0ABN1LNJ3_9ALTE
MKQLLYIALSLTLFGCAGEKVNAQNNPEKVTDLTPAKQQQDTVEMITVTGTIVYKELEGGFFALDSDDGKKYMPRGMDKTLLKHGMKVQVKGHVLKDMLTFQQYGEVLKVVEADEIDSSNVRQQNEY